VGAIVDRFRTRLLPALLLASGIALVGNGLLSYTTAVEPQPIAHALPSYIPVPTLEAGLDLPGGDGGGGTTEPSFPPDRVATRVVISKLGIDMPVIVQPPDSGDFPLCDVALYRPDLGQPGSGRATYIYAHAREGMFLPLLISSQDRGGYRMIGDVVQVYTSDNYRFLYQISEVRRHATDLVDAFNDPDARLWLQTSEGPDASYPKLQVIATFLSADKTDPNAAHPEAHPRQCQ
jgi:hypothetical protein